ncbi:MAG: phosphotransferase [Corynebacteriales bacterium]|nr:phosphotransferase [Mycobacteriales bacterium]
MRRKLRGLASRLKNFKLAPNENYPTVQDAALLATIQEAFSELGTFHLEPGIVQGRRGQKAIFTGLNPAPPHLANTRLVAKVSFVTEPAVRASFLRRTHTHRALAAAGAPLPEVVGFSETSSVHGFPLTVATHPVSQTADRRLASAEEPERTRVLQNTGAALKKLHSVSLATTQPTGPHAEDIRHSIHAISQSKTPENAAAFVKAGVRRARMTLGTYVARRGAQILRSSFSARAARGQNSARPLGTVEHRALANLAFVRPAFRRVRELRKELHAKNALHTPPVWIHTDIHQPKIGLDDADQVTLLDPDDVRLGYQEEEFHKAYWYLIEEDGNADRAQALNNAEALGRGYGALPDHFEERLQLAIGVRLLDTLGYWLNRTDTRDTAAQERRDRFLQKYKERIIKWTKGEYPDPELVRTFMSASGTRAHRPPTLGGRDGDPPLGQGPHGRRPTR